MKMHDPSFAKPALLSLVALPLLAGCPIADPGANDSTTTAGSSETGGGDTASEPADTGPSAPGTTTGSDPSDSTGSTGSTDDGSDAADSSSDDSSVEGDSSSGGDPCDVCDPLASCVDSACVCPAGYEGDGTACTDANECRDGSADCHANATCTNEEGSFSCACDSGFVGDGLECVPATSCADDPCSPNASCTDDAEGFSCVCDDDFEGDGFVCDGTLGYGEFCDEDFNACETGICIVAPYNHCTDICDAGAANDCNELGLAGLCIEVPGEDGVCVGDLDTGNDSDDAVLEPGDTLNRTMSPLGDADLFTADLGVGDFTYVITPDFSTDVQVEFYDGNGSPLAILDAGGDGVEEVGTLTSNSQGLIFTVVREIGNSTGTYSINLEAV